MAAAIAGAFTSAPCPSFWTRTSALRRHLQGSWLAGGFQRAVKLVFVLTSDFSLAFDSHGLCIPEEYASFGCTRSMAQLVDASRGCGALRSSSVSTSSISCRSVVRCVSSCCSRSRGPFDAREVTDSQECVWFGFPWFPLLSLWVSGVVVFSVVPLSPKKSPKESCGPRLVGAFTGLVSDRDQSSQVRWDRPGSIPPSHRPSTWMGHGVSVHRDG